MASPVAEWRFGLRWAMQHVDEPENGFDEGHPGGRSPLLEGDGMNELLDMPSYDTTAFPAADAGSSAVSNARQFDVRRVPFGRGRPSGGKRWSSSLCDRDLQCLVSILEDDLIPQLLGEYSPALHAPDDRFASP